MPMIKVKKGLYIEVKKGFYIEVKKFMIEVKKGFIAKSFKNINKNGVRSKGEVSFKFRGCFLGSIKVQPSKRSILEIYL
jgi:hypothetical protein